MSPACLLLMPYASYMYGQLLIEGTCQGEEVVGNMGGRCHANLHSGPSRRSQ